MATPSINDLSYLKLSGFQTYIDEVDDNTTYIGEAEPNVALTDTKWRIKKIVTSGTVTSIKWANGDPSYKHVWNNRTSYTY